MTALTYYTPSHTLKIKAFLEAVPLIKVTYLGLNKILKPLHDASTTVAFAPCPPP